MSSVGYATLQIIPSMKGMESVLRREVQSAIGGIGADAGRSGDRAGSGWGSRFTSAAGTAIRGVAQVMETTLTAAAVGVGGVVGAALFSGWDRLTSIQDATSTMTVLLQDPQKAAELLDSTMQTVTGTPYKFDSFASGAANLVAFGVEADKIPGYLDAIADAAATRGGEAQFYADRLMTVFGQVSAAGNIQLMDVWRMSDVGVNALAILANEWGVTTTAMKKMISDGAVPAERALDALARGITEGSDGIAGQTIALGGLADTLGEQLSGSLANMRTAVARFGANLLEPFTGPLTEAFGSITGLFDALGEKANEWATRLAESPALQRFTEWLAGLPDAIRGATSGLGDLNRLAAPILGLFTGIASGGLASALGPLGGIVPKLNPLLGLFAGLVATSQPLQEAFGRIFDRVQPLLASLGERLGPILAELVPPIERLLAVGVDLLGDVFEAALPILGELVAVIVPVADALLDALTPAFEDLRGLLPQLTEAVLPLIPALGEILVAIVPLAAVGVRLLAAGLTVLAPILADVIGWIATGVTWLSERLAPALATSVDFVTRFVDALTAGDWDTVGAMFGEAWENLKTVVGTVVDWIGDEGLPLLQEKLGEWALAFGSWVADAAPKLLAGLGTLLVGLGVWIGSTALPWIGRKLGEWATAFGAWVADAIPALTEGLGNLLHTIADWMITTALPAIVSNLVSWGLAFWAWTIETALNLPIYLKAVADAVVAWLAEAVPDLAVNLLLWTGAFAGWVLDVLGKLPGWTLQIWDAIRIWLEGVPGEIATAAAGMWDGLYEAFISALNMIIEAWNGLSFTMPEIEVFGQTVGGWTLDTPDIPLIERHDGGIVPGRPGQEVPILAMAGETVLPTHKPGWSLGRSNEIHHHYEGIPADEAIEVAQRRTLRDLERMETAVV